MRAAVEYVKAGFALVPIPAGQKGPRTHGWQEKASAITTVEDAEQLPEGINLGLAHRWCRTCALDIDAFDLAEPWLRERGVDLTALLMADDAVQDKSGRDNRAKLIYRLPEGVDWLPTDKPPRSGLELRCANRDGSSTMQDVLPPSIHPDTGKPYEWVGDWRSLPVLPAPLLTLWRSLQEPRQAERPLKALNGATAPAGHTGRTRSVAEIREALTFIDADDYLQWLEVGMALHAEFNGSAEGLDLWEMWSASSEKYEFDVCPRKWAGFNGQGLTGAAIFGMAKQAGADLSRLAHEARPKKETPAKATKPALKVVKPDGSHRDPVQPPPNEPPERAIHPYGEDDFALKFADVAPDVRHVFQWGKWLAWDGTRWKEDQTQCVMNRIRSFCQGYAVGSGAEKRANKRGFISAVAGFVSMDERIAADIERWDKDIWLLNTPSGVIDLRTGAVSPANPELHMTKCTPVAPSGQSERSAYGCPRWMQFMGEITQENIELMEFLQRFAGYALSGSIREQVFAFLYGSGANGKGTFMNTLMRAMGDYAIASDSRILMEQKTNDHPTSIARLCGARMVSTSETGSGSYWNEERIKAITGGDPITAHFMRQDDFTFLPQFKLFVSGNHKPHLRNVDDAIKRRLILIPFNNSFPEESRDLKLTEKLEKEQPGILQWMIDGAVKYQERGLDRSTDVRAATDAYFESQDLIGEWLTDYCDLGNEHWEPSGRLFESWCQFCESIHMRSGRQSDFSGKLERIPGVEFGRDNRKGRHWTGIRLKLKPIQGDGFNY